VPFGLYAVRYTVEDTGTDLVGGRPGAQPEA